MKESSKVANYRVLGVMSGTSLDGIDMALVQLTKKNEHWSFELISSKSVAYSAEWTDKIQNAFHLKREDLDSIDMEYGELLGSEIRSFLKTVEPNPDFIASHGHTIFHKPEEAYTLQIGNARAIYETTGLPVINNFRALDVSLGGQGAPLVPVGDRLLFSEFDYCLNLGGIANISFESPTGRMAYDICPFNMALNYLCQPLGLSYDDKGAIARSGAIDAHLLAELNAISYCASPPPKSLGYEDFLSLWKPIMDRSSIPTKDKLRTMIEHCTQQIASTLEASASSTGRLLVTGGGAFNDFFIEQLKQSAPVEVHVPEAKIIEFKEAIVFALLGVLRLRNEPNCLASVTGAEKDNCGGDMYGF